MLLCVCADLQNPPNLIEEFIKNWENGYKVICAVKAKTKENIIMTCIRKIYYKLLRFYSGQDIIANY